MYQGRVHILEGATLDVLHRPHVSKAQHGLPGLRVSGCLGSPSHAESAEHKTHRQVIDHLSEVKQGGTSPRETLGHGGDQNQDFLAGAL